MTTPAATKNTNTNTYPSSTISIPKELRNLIAGGLAGMLAKSIVAPLDRIKILYQVTSVPFYIRNVPSVMMGIVRTEGILALWRGNTATMIRIFPYAGIQFMVFNRCKVYCADRHEQQQQQQHNEGSQRQQQDSKWGMRPIESLVAGSCAGAVSVLCTYPLDLTRAQLAVSKRKKLSSVGYGFDKKHGFLYTLKGNYTKGGPKRLFRGITPTLLGILPYAGIAFTINEQAKRQVYKLTGRDPTTIEKIQCGAISGLVAQSVTYPLEVTRRRMQTIGMVPASGKDTALGVITSRQKIESTTKPKMVFKAVVDGIASTTKTSTTTTTKSPSMVRIMKQVVKEQGIRGFYKGLSMNWLKGPVSFSISFTTFDILQGWMESEEERVNSRGTLGANNYDN